MDDLTPAERAAAIAKAKSVAVSLSRAVARRDAFLIQQISDGLTREELAAVMILALSCCDDTTLLALSKTLDNGLPEIRTNAA